MSQATPAIATIVTQIQGTIVVERHGKSIVLKEGDAVYGRDTIKTEDGALQLNFADGSTAFLGPQSVLAVQEYSHGMGEDSYVLKLAIGAIRCISGKVLEENPDAFKVITPKATVGIRGTDFLVKVNADASEEFIVLSLDQGHNLVITTHEGELISIINDNEGVELPANSTTLLHKVYSDEEIQRAIKDLLLELRETEGVSITDQAHLLLVAQPERDLLEDIHTNEGTAHLGDELDDNLSVAITMPSILQIPPLPTATTPSTPTPTPTITTLYTSGNVNFYTDDEAGTPSGSNESQTIYITNDMSTANVIISGDRSVLASGSMSGGHDTIIAKNMAEGRIVGDVNFATGMLRGGDDHITIDTNKTGGNSIYGDAYDAASGFEGGDDTIIITGNFYNSYIFGDAYNVAQNVGNPICGNDSIIIKGNFGITGQNSFIYGDTNQINTTENGNDSILIKGNATSGEIIAGTGDDSITVKGNSDDVHYAGGSGNDNIIIEGTLGPYGGSTIAANDGNDFIEVEKVISSATITADDGHDTILIHNLTHGTIMGGNDNDSITVNTFVEGTISDGGGKDYLDVTLGNYPGSCTISLSNDAMQDIVNINSSSTNSYGLEIVNFVLNTDIFKFNGHEFQGTDVIAVLDPAMGYTSKLFADAVANNDTVMVQQGMLLFEIHFTNP